MSSRPTTDLLSGAWDWDGDPEFQQYCRATKPLLGELCALTRHSDCEVRQAAVRLIADLRKEGSCAIDELQELVLNEREDPLIRLTALSAMFAVTPETTPVMPRILSAMDSIGAVVVGSEPGASDAGLDSSLLPISIGMTGFYLAIELTGSGHTMVEVPHLMAVASGKYRPETRALSLIVLAGLGPEAQDAVPQLWPLLEDRSEYVRLAAANAVFEITQDASLADPVARRLKLDLRQRVTFVEEVVARFQATKALDRVLLTEVLKDPDWYVTESVVTMRYAPGPYRRASLRFVAELGPAARSAVPELRRQLLSSDPETRTLAMRALVRIDPDSAASIATEQTTCRTGSSTHVAIRGALRTGRCFRRWRQAFRCHRSMR